MKLFTLAFCLFVMIAGFRVFAQESGVISTTFQQAQVSPHSVRIVRFEDVTQERQCRSECFKATIAFQQVRDNQAFCMSVAGLMKVNLPNSVGYTILASRHHNDIGYFISCGNTKETWMELPNVIIPEDSHFGMITINGVDYKAVSVNGELQLIEILTHS